MARYTIRQINENLKGFESRAPEIVRGVVKLFDSAQDTLVERLELESRIVQQAQAAADAAVSRKWPEMELHLVEVRKARDRSAQLDAHVANLKEVAQRQLSELGEANTCAMALAPIPKILHDLRLSEDGELLLRKIVDRCPRIDWSAV